MAKAGPHASSIQAAHFLVNSVVLVHGCFKGLLTDRNRCTHFTGEIVRNVLKLLVIKQLLTTSHDVTCAVAAERALKTFVTILSHHTSTNLRN